MKLHPLRKYFPALLALTAGVSLVFAVTQGVPVNAICPVTEKPADPARTVTYSKEVSFCCEVCKTSFIRNPDEKVKEVAAAKPGEKCLMCDKPSDAGIKATYSRLIALRDDTCVPAFKTAPDKFIVFAVTHPRPVNSLCPLTGKKVDPACTANYQKTVLFCSGECQETFVKAPDKHVDGIVRFVRTGDKCLLCDKPYDPERVEVYRRTIGFSDKSSALTFKSDPDAYIATAVKNDQ